MQLKLLGKYLVIREVSSLNKKTKGQNPTEGRFFPATVARECAIWPDGGREPKSNSRLNKE